MTPVAVSDWQYVDVDGVRTRYREAGAGDEVIVLIHGGEFGINEASTWPPSLLEMLGEHHRVIAFDRLGHGLTDNPKTERGYRMSAVLDHSAAFLRAMAISDATLIGQSRGGYVAARLAKEHPELAKRLVIINSASLAIGVPAEAVPGMPSYEVFKSLGGGARDARQDASVLSVSASGIDDEYLAERQAIQQSDKAVEARRVFSEVGAEFFRELECQKADTVKWLISGGLMKPTLLIWGVGDPTLTAENGLELFKAIGFHNPRVRAKFISHCGHAPHREYTDEVGREINAFIELN